MASVLMLATAYSATSRSQTIESLVMPGDVVQAHAEIESDCSACHVMFDRDSQRGLCLDCHEDVALDIDNRGGYHGLFEDARSQTCANCHTDHEGRNAQIVLLDESTFDHDFTDFALIGGHLEAVCNDCHEIDQRYRDAPSSCASCHSDDDPHDGFAGEVCTDCHTPQNWQEVQFDHDTTGFSLVGGHLEPACTDCHSDPTFQETETTCYGCHAADDVHNGRSGQECESCHTPLTWSDSSFDHARDTSFMLGGRHGELTCADCHSDDPFDDALDVSCISCHVDDDEHSGHFGQACDTCHNDRNWSDNLFDHERDVGHSLLGAHESIECESCHIEPIFEVALLAGCNDCHAADDPHDGEQGTECRDCHNEASWTDSVFFDHDLTRFPLLGRHADAACNDCHESAVFRDAPEDCVDCHLDIDPHDGRFTADCSACHNPVDWSAWQFDHDLLTDFPLDGAHTGLTCNDCHRQPLSAMGRLSDQCGNCHRSDDIHNGEFGPDCGRCHSAENFRDVREIQ